MAFIFDNIYATISAELKENLDFLSTDDKNGFEEIIRQVCSVTGVSYIETVPEKLYGAWNSVRDAHDMLLGVLLCKNIGRFDKCRVNKRRTEISREDNTREVTLSEHSKIRVKNAKGGVSRNTNWEQSEYMERRPAQTGSRKIVVDLSNTNPESSSNYENQTNNLPVPQNQNKIQPNNLLKDMLGKKDDNFGLKYQHCMSIEQSKIEKFSRIEQDCSCDNKDQILSDNTVDMRAQASHDDPLYSTDKELSLSPHKETAEPVRLWKSQDSSDCGIELQKDHGNMIISNTSKKPENSICFRASDSQLVDVCSSVDKSNQEKVSMKTMDIPENEVNCGCRSMKSREISDEEENTHKWGESSLQNNVCGRSNVSLTTNERHHDHHQESVLDSSTVKIKQEMEDFNEITDMEVNHSNVNVITPVRVSAASNLTKETIEIDRKPTVTIENSEKGYIASDLPPKNFNNSEQMEMPSFFIRNSDDYSAAKFFCTSCCYSSNHHKQICDHMKRVHFKKFNCQKCPAKFGLQKDLTRHYRKTHKMFIESKPRGRQVNSYKYQIPVNVHNEQRMIQDEQDPPKGYIKGIGPIPVIYPSGTS